MLVIAAPGQGAQVPGFLAPWLDLPGVADRLMAWSALAGCDLIACGTTAGAEEITDTAIAQPLLVAASLARPPEALSGGLGRLRKRLASRRGAASGNSRPGRSLSVLTPEDAMRLVSVRAGPWRAAAAGATGMTAALGGDQDEVLAALGAATGSPRERERSQGRSWLQAPRPSSPRWRRTQPQACGCAADRGYARSTPPTWPPAVAAARGGGKRDRARSRHRADLQRRRCAVKSCRDWLERIVTGEHPGPVGPVHAYDGKPGRERAHRDSRPVAR
jgi:hypothetical protein